MAQKEISMDPVTSRNGVVGLLFLELSGICLRNEISSALKSVRLETHRFESQCQWDTAESDGSVGSLLIT